jgi:hypothetical protein
METGKIRDWKTVNKSSQGALLATTTEGTDFPQVGC